MPWGSSRHTAEYDPNEAPSFGPEVTGGTE
jgi:hypothetical protein